MRICFPYILLAVFVCWLSFENRAHAQTPNPDYTVIDTIPLPGATRWDYLTFDAKTNYLFITRGDGVDVLDTTLKKIVSTIADLHGTHGVALATDLGKGFISEGTANDVAVFDLITLKVTSTIPVGTKPDAIVYDTATQRVFAANGNSGDMTIIDAKDNKVVTTLTLDGKPEFAVGDGKGMLYVNLEDQSQLLAIDARNLKITGRYNLAPACNEPTGLAIDAKQERLFSVCGNKSMVVVNGTTGKIMETLPIGAHSDAAAFDSEKGLAFSSNGDGTLTVVVADGSDHYKIIQTVTTLPTARTMAVDPVTHQIYLAAAETDGSEAPTAQHPDPRPKIKPDTFKILVVGYK
jgi:YVTN family beta-propeller protein